MSDRLPEFTQEDFENLESMSNEREAEIEIKRLQSSLAKKDAEIAELKKEMDRREIELKENIIRHSRSEEILTNVNERYTVENTILKSQIELLKIKAPDSAETLRKEQEAMFIETTALMDKKMDTLEADLKEARGWLLDFEWVYYRHTDGGLAMFFCPECENKRDDGHIADCELKALLSRFPEPAKEEGKDNG